MERIVLSAYGYQLSVSPKFGANIIGLDWTNRAGRLVHILRACEDDQLLPNMPSPVGCFPMAPFANRIDGGTFPFEGRIHVLPINRPDENVAIHGLSRFATFDVLSQTASTLSLMHRYRGDVFAYDLTQEFRIDPSGVSVQLTIINHGKRMPYGLGFHPYFMRDGAAQLQFCASAMSQAEERHLPARFIAPQSGPEFSAGAHLDGLDEFDAHYAGWDPRQAILHRPEAGIRVTLSAVGAFTNLHIYVPPGGSLVCIEPVSHVPDVYNRPMLAEYGKLTILRPGDTLNGSMHLSVLNLTSTLANLGGEEQVTKRG
jgi:aldose 1-epimerase